MTTRVSAGLRPAAIRAVTRHTLPVPFFPSPTPTTRERRAPR
jgi:hypothetical protein